MRRRRRDFKEGDVELDRVVEVLSFFLPSLAALVLCLAGSGELRVGFMLVFEAFAGGLRK